MSQPDTIDWNGLFIQTKSGEEYARNTLCKHLEVRLKAIAQYRLWGWQEDDINDLVQNTILVVLEKLDQIDSNPHFFALNVLRNKIGDALRQRTKGTRNLSMDVSENKDAESDRAFLSVNQMPEDASDFTADVELSDYKSKIVKAVKSMTKFCQMFFMAVLEERSVSEVRDISEKTEPNLTRAAFDKRIFDCRKKLRLILKDVEF